MKRILKVAKVALFLCIFGISQPLLAQTVTGTGTSNYVPKFSGAHTISNSQIWDSVKVGVGTAKPTSYMHILAPSINNGIEHAFQIQVSDDSLDYFKIENSTTANGVFAPTYVGHCQTNQFKIPLYFIGSTSQSNDQGLAPVMRFDTRMDSGNTSIPIKNDVCFQWTNFTRNLMQVNANGYFGIGTTSPSAHVHINTIDSLTNTYSFKVGNTHYDLFGIRDDGMVGVGTFSPIAKFDVESNHLDTIAIYSNQTLDTTTTTYAIVGNSSNHQTGSSNAWSVGVKGMAYSRENSTRAKGVEGYAALDGIASSGNGYGLYGSTSNAGSSNTYYAVYGLANSGGSNTYWAGYFNGDAGCTANLWTISDGKFKDNVAPLNGALANIMLLKPKAYTFRSKDYPGINFAQGQQMGLIAQDLEQVFPNLVRKDQIPATLNKEGKVVNPSVDYKGVNYIGLIPVLIASIQEQQSMIQAQQSKIDAQDQQNAQLQNTVSDLQTKYNSLLASVEQIKMLQMQCCNIVPGNTGSNNSPDNLTPSLQQNVPNPFNLSTIIKYYLPNTMSNAVISVKSLDGTVIASYPVTNHDNGQITINAGTMKPGSYIYDLVSNGIVVDSKKMVIVGQ